MATAEILQEYLVKLGFQTDAISAKKLEDTLGATNKKIFGVGVAVAGMVLAAERGVAAFAGKMERLHYSSKLTDTSVAKLQSLSFAAEQIGISGEVASGMVQKLAQDLKLMPGTLGLVEGAFGISTKGKESADVYFELLDKMKVMSPTLGTMWAEKLFGMDQSTFLLTMGNLDKLKEKYREHQQTIRNTGTDMDEAAKVLTNYNNQLRTTEANLDRLGVAMAKNLAPTFTAINKQLNVTLRYWTKFLGGDVSSWEDMFQFFKDIPKAAGKATLATAGLLNPWGSWKDYQKYYSEDSGGRQAVSGKIRRPPQGKPSERGIYSSLSSLGWSPHEAIGIMANLQKESGYDPRAIGDEGKAYGIAQWHPDRQKDFQEKYGKNIRSSTLEEQLLFLTHELREGKEQKAGSLLRGAQSPEEATRILSLRYERPQGGLAEATIRERMASALGARLGVSPGGNGQLVQNNTTNINVSGTGAEATARAVGREQSRVLSQATREFVGRQAG